MQPLFVANWKMHGNLQFLHEWAQALPPPPAACSVVVCPPLPYLMAARAALPANILIGAQTVAAAQENGAYTGEVAADMLVDSGCTLAIIGHSERRAMQHETDTLCAAKIKAAAAAGLRPLLCIGEDADVHARGIEATTATVLAQLDAALDGADAAILSHLIIAYEPIWAIGSGLTPQAEDISTLHNALRQYLIEKITAFGGKITLLYGGSVNASNAKTFIGIENVNGFLVGGASLQPQAFAAICNSFIPS